MERSTRLNDMDTLHEFFKNIIPDDSFTKKPSYNIPEATSPDYPSPLGSRMIFKRPKSKTIPLDGETEVDIIPVETIHISNKEKERIMNNGMV
jgi:hypothetical protein